MHELSITVASTVNMMKGDYKASGYPTGFIMHLMYTIKNTGFSHHRE